jgi:ABC-2 type transport system ATP-binding protein
MDEIVQVNNLRKQFDAPKGPVAVKDLSFSIRRGEFFSLLGPNGAGKTTTISMLSCLQRPTSGDATIAGHSITRSPQKVKSVIGVVPQEIALYPTLSAHRNLLFWGKMYGLGGSALKERIAAVLELAGLSDRANDRVEVFSGGMKRRLNIAVGLLHNPQVVYLDEPTVGIDPQSRRRILDTLKELNKQGCTILYTTHYMEEAQELSDRVGIIDHGELIALGSLAEITQTVGSLDTLQIELESADAVDGVVGQLAQIESVAQVHAAENESLVIQTHNAHQSLPSILGCLNDAGLKMKHLDIQEPNLETVFLHLTGRALRD